MHIDLAGPAGRLEALLDVPAALRAVSSPAALRAVSSPAALRAVSPPSVPGTEPPPRPHAAVVFAHPHPMQGGSMHTKAVFQGARGLVRIGCAVLRFNFRGVGASTGIFDHGAGEGEDYRVALDYMAATYPGVPLWTAGFSFGSWIALETGAVDPRVSALIAVAPPVTREGYSFPHTRESTKPKFFVQGDLDELCPLKDLLAFYSALHEPKELVVIDGGTHLFDGKTAEVGEALEDLLGGFE